MPKITIDSIEFNTEDLSENGLLILKDLQYLQKQMGHIKNKKVAYQAANQTYIKELKSEIHTSEINPISLWIC